MGIYPNYLQVHASGELQRRAEEAVAGLASCRVCPRQCGVARLHDERQSCDTGRRARVHGAVVHHGEETCISGARGSGTLFFPAATWPACSARMQRSAPCGRWETTLLRRSTGALRRRRWSRPARKPGKLACIASPSRGCLPVLCLLPSPPKANIKSAIDH